MAKTAATINIGVNVPAAEIRKAEQQLQSLFNKSQSFSKNPIVAKNFTQPLGRITGAANEFNKSLEASNARVIAFGASAGAIFAVQKAMTELVKTTIKVEQRFTNIQALLGSTGKEFDKLTNGLFKAAKSTGSSFDQAAESMEEFARQGLNTEESLKRTTAAMTLVKLGGMDAKNATESLTAAMNTFGKAAGDSTTIVNKLAQVDAKFAVSSGDLAEAIKRTGAAAVSANVSFEELIAIVTTAQEKTARGGAVIGNSFKTIFTRIQRPETLNQLRNLGVVVRDSNKELLPAIQILKNYAKIYDGLRPSIKATSSEMLAGVFQVNVLKAVLPELASSVGKYDNALQVANKTTNEATERMAFLTSTTEGALNKTMVNLTKFAKEVGDLTVKPALDNMIKLLNGFADLISPKNFFGLGETIGTAVYKGMGKIISGPGLILLGAVIIKIGARLAVFVKDAAAGFVGLETASQKLASTQTVIQNILAQRPALIQQATSSEEGMVAVARVLADKLKQSRREMELLTSAAKKAAPAVIAMQGGAKRTGGKKAAGGFVPSFNMTPSMSNTAASGFVPNFNAASAERRMASAGGYQAGKIKQGVIPGVGQVTYNGNETVQSMPGLQQPAIMPPSLSSAGRGYRDAFQKMHGYNPYNSASGFVPNFADGYINPRDGQMIKPLTFARRMNLEPTHKNYITADEATKANYIPSRATAWKDKGGKKGTQDRRRQGGADKRMTHSFDTAGRVGILSMFGGKTKQKAERKQAYLDVEDIKALKALVKKAPELANDRILFDNVQVAGVHRLSDRADNKEGKNFSKFIGEAMAEPLAGLASDFGKTYLGNELSAKSKKDLSGTLKKAGSYLNPGTEGDLFELAVRALVTKSSELKSSFDTNRSFKQPFDFEETGIASPRLIEMFGYESSLLKADAKRSATQDQVNSVVRKSYNQGLLHEEELGAMFSQSLPGLSSKNSVRGAYLSPTQRQRAKEKLDKSLASGFVPNFAAAGSTRGAKQAAARVGAISDAITREDRAGVRRDKVRVGVDKRLTGGIGVYNTDEGSLGNAINMHMANGANKKSIQTMGKAMGFIPNFAAKTNQKTEPTGGMGGDIGLIIAAGYLSSFGDSLKESESALTSFSGSVVSTGANMVMYAATFKMVADTFGGMDAVAKKLKGGLSKVTEGFSKGRAALNQSVSGISNPLMTDRAGRATSRTLKGGRRRRRSLSEMMAGRTSGGNERVSRGSSFMEATRMRGRRMKAGAGRGIASLGRGAGSLGSAASGGLLKGGAAVAGGAALGVGAAALGLVKVHQMIQEKERMKRMQETDAAVAKNVKSFDNLNSALGRVGALTQEYAEAVEKGNVEEQKSLKRKIVQKMSIATEDGGSFNQFLRSKGGSFKMGDADVTGRKSLLSTLADPNTSVGDITSMKQQMEAFTAIMDKQNEALKGAIGGYKTFESKQNKGFGQIIGVGSSTDLTPDERNKIGASFADLADRATPEQAARGLKEFQKLQDQTHNLNRTGNANNDGDFSVLSVITEGEMRAFNSRLMAAMKGLGMTAENARGLAGSMEATQDVNGNNEKDMNMLNMVITGKVITRLTSLAAAAEETAESLDATVFRTLHDEVSDFNDTIQDVRNKFNLDRGLEKIIESEVMGMFDITTKNLNDTLGKTASKLSQIQVSHEIKRQKLDLATQQTASQQAAENSESIFQTIKTLTPKTSLVKADGFGTGFDMEKFMKMFKGGKSLGDTLIKEAQTGNLKAVDAALAKAIGSGDLVPTIKQNLQELSRATKQQIEESKTKTILDKKGLESQKRLITAQEKAAIAQNELSQRIAFMGGLSGGSGNPEKFIRDIRSGQIQRGSGQFTGSSDEKTQGLLNVAKSLNSLNLGKSNFTDALLAPIRTQIASNIAKGLAGIGVKGLGQDNSVVQQIAKDQVDNLIKPDKDLGDIADILQGQDGFGPLNNCIEANSVKVKIINWMESAEGSKQEKDQIAAKEKERVRNLRPSQEAMVLDSVQSTRQVQKWLSPKAPIQDNAEAVRLSASNAAVAINASNIGNDAYKELDPNNPPKWIIDTVKGEMKTRKAIEDNDGKMGAVKLKTEALQKEKDKKVDTFERLKANRRVEGRHTKDHYQTEIDKLSEQIKKLTETYHDLGEEGVKLKKQTGEFRRKELDNKQKAENQTRQDAADKKKAAEDKRKAAKEKAGRRVSAGVAGLLGDQKGIGGIRASLRMNRNVTKSSNPATMPNATLANNNTLKELSDSFISGNENIPDFIKEFGKSIKKIGKESEKAMSNGDDFTKILLKVKREFAELQVTADMDALKDGIKGVDEVEASVRRLIELRFKEGLSVHDEIKNLEKVIKKRQELNAASAKSRNAIQFIDDAAATISLLTEKFTANGISTERLKKATDEILAVQNKQITATYTHSMKLKDLNDIQARYNVELAKTREQLGLADQSEVEQALKTKFQTSSQRTAKDVTEAINDMIITISGADYYKTAEGAAVRTKQMNSKLAESLRNDTVLQTANMNARVVKNAKNSIQLGNNPVRVMEDMNLQLKNNALYAGFVKEGFLSINEAFYLMGRDADDAEAAVRRLSREFKLLGTYDPRADKEKAVREARKTALEGGDPFPALYGELADQNKSKGKRDMEVGAASRDRNVGELSRFESEAMSSNLNAGARAFAASKDGGAEAEKEVIALDRERVALLLKHRDGAISLNEAETKLGKSRAGLNLRSLKQEFKEGTITADEYRQGINAFSEAMTKGAMTSKEKSTVLKEELSSMFVMGPNENFTRMKDNVKDLFMTFREGTKGALVEVINGTSDMRTAFAKVFMNLGEKMLQDSTSLFVDNLFSAASGFVTGREKGGIVGYNSGGMVRGGSGIRDDVPAMLSKGEFVVRKSAVDKYGMGFLNNLNGKGVAGYAMGGSVNLKNQYDYTGGAKRPTGGNLNVDSQMSAFAQTDANNPMNQLKFDREQTLDGYLKEKAQYDEMKKKAMMDYKTQRRKVIQSAVIQIAMAGATAGLGAMSKGGKGGAKGKMKKAGGKKGSFSAFGKDLDGNKVAKNFASKADAKSFFPGSFKGMKVKSDKPGFFSSAFGNKQKFGKMKSFKNRFGGMASGGYMGGDRDNIPSLLTGGEYVVKKSAVDAYGVDFFNKVNTGRMQKFASGGLVGEGGSRESSITEGTGGAPSNVSNNFTINITVEKDGTVNSDGANEDGDTNKNTQGALAQEEKNKQFGGVIKDAVIREIVDQKRPGGLLYNEKRTS